MLIKGFMVEVSNSLQKNKYYLLSGLSSYFIFNTAEEASKVAQSTFSIYTPVGPTSYKFKNFEISYKILPCTLTIE